MLCIGVACVVAAQLTNVDMGYSNNMPTTAMSYDGVARDISEFYNDNQLNYTVDGTLYFSTGTRVTLGMDNGIKSDKLRVSNQYRVGVDQIMSITDNSYLTFSGHTEIGGNVRETPCLDSYNREYYCGNLTAWSDHKGIEDEQTYNIGIRYTRRF